MNSSIFILSSRQEVEIERLHVVTWDIGKKNYYTEYGLEISTGSLDEFSLLMSLPSLSQNPDDIICLAENLSDPENCRFIFNSDIEMTCPVDGGVLGGRVKFRNDREISILPLPQKDVDNGLLQINLRGLLDLEAKYVYIRFLIKSDIPPFQTRKKELTRLMVNYDIRVNESRTAPKDVRERRNKGYSFMKIKHCFCFHIIPIAYRVEFIDNKNLKSLRELESETFERYLGPVAKRENITLRKSSYNIMFCKLGDSSDYSFFTSFSKDHISNLQLAIGLLMNILCSSLFAIHDLRSKWDGSIGWYNQIPVEYWLVLVLMGVLGWILYKGKR